MPDPDRARVLAYHARTKHRPGRYAASLGYLDWDSQPNPFRIHDGAELLPLARAPLPPGPSLADLHAGSVAPHPLGASLLDALLLHSLALSAWKEHGRSRWSLRVNPSSGNLHPTEAYLLAPPIPDLSQEPALLHYSPLLHALERRASIPADVWTTLTADLPPTAVLVGLASIPWREAWKYGERAFRYCQHDVGHALAALAYAAALVGWRAHPLTCSDAALAALLGLRALAGDEPEIPEALVVLVPSDMSLKPSTLRAWSPPASVVSWFATTDLAGAANRLSADHHPWPILAEVSAATRTPEQPPPASAPEAAPAAIATPVATPAATPRDPAGPDAATVIRRRRSAVAMDGRTGLARAAFYDLLLRTAPATLPLTVLDDPPRVDLALFVHRVANLDPGLYFLLRDPARAARWRAATDPEFQWQPAPGRPADLDLYTLKTGDARRTAAAIACNQDIAADGCFAVAMLADFTALARAPWAYRRLFWETGAIGQVLYLEAEALGISATGIGCFFDDVMHDLLGLPTDPPAEFQSLYHFTVGGRVDDDRLRTLDPYHHLSAAARA